MEIQRDQIPASTGHQQLTRVRDVMQKGVVCVNETDSVALAHQLMLWNGIRHLPVLRLNGRKLIGIVSERDILRAVHASRDTEDLPVCEIMSTPADHIHPNAFAADAAADMTSKRLGCLPVVDAGEVVGIVTTGDLLGMLAQYPAKRGVVEHGSDVVASIMYPEPIAVHADDRLVMTAQRMAQKGVRHACVVDGEGAVIGILSDRDVRRFLGDPRRTLDGSGLPRGAKEARVSDAMTANPTTIDQDETIRAALARLVTFRYGALPVVDGKQHLRGIVSYLDVLQHFATLP